MTCYFRWIRDILDEAGVDLAKIDKRDVDRVIHGIVGVEYKNCSETWKRLKVHLAKDRDGLIAEIHDGVARIQS
ncbi:MAG: hypothetical protein ACP6IT_05755 [Candidatus Thorarchaeota archaeon]